MAEAAEETTQSESDELRREFVLALESGDPVAAGERVADLHPAEIAHLLESLPAADREPAWEVIRDRFHADVLSYLNDDLRAELLHRLSPEELVEAAQQLDIDDLADVLPDMPDAAIQAVLNSLDDQRRSRLDTALAYPEDSAGGLMNLDAVTVRGNITVDVVLRYLRRLGDLPDATDTLFVVSREGRYLGHLPLSELVTAEPGLTVAEVMRRDLDGIPGETPAHDVAKRFEHRDLISAPVVDTDGTLLGRITIDDVVDVIRDEGEHSFLSMAGVQDEEDMFAPVRASARRRVIWLGLNMVAAFVAARVIGLFEASLQQAVALAVLMPVVASMGGIAGNQTLALVIRGLALDQIGPGNTLKLLRKEITVGLVNGLGLSVLIAGVAWAWFGDPALGGVIALALIINLFMAAVAGTLIPLLLRRLGGDPALGGGMLLMTVTDVTGFGVFLGLATLLLL
ncbi:magnesium transporter [Thiohalospira halophila DSM 15071]|uniref:Magnesium transporter MgtE n=1 Tax=Thiohalospira halophila DSM 15071 TaxID=1123397 RepID=A0A1I1QVF9_9GAMM|nr:magnesium transporter [Thiohalospira halophila]SFD26025.1 magnesium transporter [Thiohalospira halophila DSM 15071]